jgi:subtilisin
MGSSGFRRLRGFEGLETRIVLSHAALPIPPLDPWAAEANEPDSVWASDAGNSPADALNLGAISGALRVRGAVGRGDTSDYFAFRLQQPGQLVVELTGLQADADLTLRDAAGRLLLRSSRGGRASESLTRSLPTGTYLIAVTSYMRSATSYQLRIAVTDQRPAPVPPTGPPTVPPTDSPTEVPSDMPPDAQPDLPPELPPGLPRADTPPGMPGNDVTAPPKVVPYYGGANEWNLNRVGAPTAWSEGATGAGVVVAVLDTGVDRSHADLRENIWTNLGEIAGDRIDNDGNGWIDDVFGWNFAAGSNDTLDRNGHGTHVAGTIAAVRNGWGATGVAPDAKIMPVSVLSDTGGGRSSDVAAGIRYAVSNGADIINLSLGGGFSSQIASAIEFAWEQGVLVVAASGNQSANIPEYPARHSGEWDNVISVSGYDRGGSLAGFSNRVGSSGAVQLDAPGREIYSTVPGSGFALYSGTSMAAPHVAGVAALLLSGHAGLSPAGVRNVLLATATPAARGSDALGSVTAAGVAAGARDIGLAGGGTLPVTAGMAPGRGGGQALAARGGSATADTRPSSLDTGETRSSWSPSSLAHEWRQGSRWSSAAGGVVADRSGSKLGPTPWPESPRQMIEPSMLERLDRVLDLDLDWLSFERAAT